MKTLNGLAEKNGYFIYAAIAIDNTIEVNIKTPYANNVLNIITFLYKRTLDFPIHREPDQSHHNSHKHSQNLMHH